MPVPGTFSDLSETPSSNSPTGAEPVGTNANDYIQTAFAFIKQLYDGKWLPNVAVAMNSQKLTGLANGVANQDAATIAQLNATLGAPSGTRMPFQQAAAPAGWFIDTASYAADAAMRLVTSGPSKGGTAPWSNWNFGGSFTTAAHVLTQAEMPAHTHGDLGHTHSVNDPAHNHGLFDPGHVHTIPNNLWSDNGGGGSASSPGSIQMAHVGQGTGSVTTGISIGAAATGIWLNNGFANLGNTGGNGGHSHTFQGPQTKYVDFLICQKA